MRVGVAVLAKAPIPGFAKTRLIPALGPEGAARLQEHFVARALRTAVAAGIGPVTLWCAPDASHPALAAAAREAGPVELLAQPDGDLGRRMLAAFERSAPLVLVGVDCPCLDPDQLRAAARALRDGADAAIAPAEDGGYGLLAAAAPFPALFEGMPWSTPAVADETRRRAAVAGLVLSELAGVWDVDTPEDLARLQASGLLGGAGGDLQPMFRSEASA